ncbi:protein of unknown function DUF159 [Echinococcus multilocularis]|uniref:Abasic site processing protein HMCES n=1 Tax=Echinococcus multilocularis TaxID=6211 RepID=A0A068Y4U9_ECHMU|nr:protein of unknown function DUF159 [Echinococcus multilocularis]
MCGRTACSLRKESILERLASQFNGKKKFEWRSAQSVGDFAPSFNKAPGSFNPVIISSSHLNSAFECNAQLGIVQVMLWGLIPSFVTNALQQASSGNKFATANARAENILERPSYMDCIKHRRRCVILAQGIITTRAVSEVANIHDRMPVIFRDPEDIFEWINPELCSPVSTVRFLQQLINKLKLLELKIYPVTPLMNSTSYDCPQCIEPLDHSKPSVWDCPKDRKIAQLFTMKRKISENTESTLEEESASKKRLEDL